MGWEVGVGEKAKIDDKWRIVIPSKFRKSLKPRDELIIEERGSEIVLRKTSKENILKEFNEIKLFVLKDFRTLGAESGKHKYGGYKD
ncbi:MAG: AbrB/MazE/SpoVT family DNA-binding domain-containing protein [Nitrososphaerota archaeon]